MTTRTILQQTGWLRYHPETLCMEQKHLKEVFEFDFQLTEEFVTYFRKRTGYNITVDIYFPWIYTDPKAEVFILSDKYLDGKEIIKEAREHAVKVLRSMKGKLQDCWEVYNKKACGIEKNVVSKYEPIIIEERNEHEQGEDDRVGCDDSGNSNEAGSTLADSKKCGGVVAHKIPTVPTTPKSTKGFF